MVALHKDNSATAENIRILAGRLNYLQQRHLFKTLLITSSTKNEGKTVIAGNLGITLASRDSKRVLLIDGDTRQATLSRIFDLESRPGLTDCMEAGRKPTQFLQRIAEMPLWILPIGGHIDAPLRTEDLARLLSGLSEGFDWIIIDSAPVTLLANAAAWSVAAERCLLVVRRAITPRSLFATALESINQQKLLGVVLNDCSAQTHAHYTRYYQRRPAPEGRTP
jgi:capsular exopolysaccharide synthesis family protein